MKSALIASVLLFVGVVSCKSEPLPEPIIILEDPLVLHEVNPLPRSVVPVYVAEYEPIYTTFRIIEVSEVNGVQQYFLARIGADRSGIEIGVSENIAEDETFEKIIGKYKIIEIFGDFFRCQIEELDYKIGETAYIRVKTGEKLKAKEE
ncbi:MAG: hypothetical protein LBV20_05210 [Treponema sp.]|nr:hypothetical protein [Treponema sp.]